MTTKRPCETCSVRVPADVPYYGSRAAAIKCAVAHYATVLRHPDCDGYAVPLHNHYRDEVPLPGALDWFLERGWEVVS